LVLADTAVDDDESIVDHAKDHIAVVLIEESTHSTPITVARPSQHPVRISRCPGLISRCTVIHFSTSRPTFRRSASVKHLQPGNVATSRSLR
jgi:hypothetical protein